MDEIFHILSKLKVAHEEKISLLVPTKMVGLKGTTFLHE